MKHLILMILILCFSLALPLSAGADYMETTWSMDIEDESQIQITYPLTGLITIDRVLTPYYFDWLSKARALTIEDMQLKEEKGFGPEYIDSLSEYTLTTEQFTADDMISFLFTEYYGRYAAVHPSTAFNGKTFRLPKGEPVSMASLVAEGQWETLISKVSETLCIDEAICEWANADEDWFKKGLSSEDALDVFALTDDALIIQFQPYQIGPYALGAARIEIPRTQLEGIIK